MLTFAMNKDNFGTYLGGGTCDGTRLLASGVQLNPERHDSDADTLALWRLSAGSWADASGNGRDLTAYGDPQLTEQGAEFDGDDDARTTYNINGNNEVTMEAWLGVAALPTATERVFCQYYKMMIYLYYSSGVTWLRGDIHQDGNTISLSHELDGSFVGTMHHVALTYERNAVNGGRLWLDGSMVDQGDTIDADFGWPTIDLLTLASRYGVEKFTGTIDEARLSQVVRYTADFQPKRLVASGMFNSPPFDAAGSQAEWLSLDWQGQTPGNTQLVMMVRAGDQLDGGGDVQGDWELLSQSLPPGRYFQWGAILVRSTDALGLSTPTLESVTTVASQAGYNIYHGIGQAATAIDYATPIAKVGPTALSHAEAALVFPAVHWFAARSVNAWDSEALTVDAEVRLELDDSGQRVPPRPASVEALEAEGAGGGCVRLSWLSMSEAGEAPTDVFRIYWGIGAVDYSTPLGEVPSRNRTRHYEWTTDPLPPGTTVLLAVRAETDAGGVDENPLEVEIEIDATAPSGVGYVTAEATLSD
ncbi:MAG: hypothetical protein GWP05_03020 [Anaerolineaceae bacterium]|nr:hypothetical protein [Anaerolineaceae bacterium]